MQSDTPPRLYKSGWVPAKTASSGMLLVNPFVSSIGGEAQ
ncbi:hypothetical protein T01_14903 [Trichinella spiralis]|uniref:Uncharacterized protein n=1 Tax=Trichinella spiralis TaxID=6334 RepID=A0A0V0ZLB9_TRISP|nr:hypothetical protein T01_14903 [Trichinella spiralis]